MRFPTLDMDIDVDIPDIIDMDCPYCGMKRARFILIPDSPTMVGNLDEIVISSLHACEGCRGWVEISRTYRMKGRPKTIPIDDMPVSFSPRPKARKPRSKGRYRYEGQHTILPVLRFP